LIDTSEEETWWLLTLLVLAEGPEDLGGVEHVVPVHNPADRQVQGSASIGRDALK
jgi:hypothetical protein